MRIPELAFILAQEASGAELQHPAVEDAISTYNLKYSSYIDPKVEDCLVDTSNYPTLQLYWPKKGPAYGAKEEAIIVSQKTGDSEDVAYRQLNDFELEVESSYRFVDVVLAMDTSGSMSDNAEIVKKIEAQVSKEAPNAKIRIWTIKYDTAVEEAERLEAKKPELKVESQKIYGRVSRVRKYESPLVARPMYFRNTDVDESVVEGSEEDHLGAAREGIKLLKNLSAKSKKYVVLVTDEGQRRYKAGEELKVVKEAKKAGVEIHLLYSKDNGGGWLKITENFTSLINLAVSSGGSAMQMEKGKIPNVFNTNVSASNFVSIDFEDTNPYEAGERTWTVSNGEGAICKSEVTEEIIEKAIAQGRLEAPNEEIKETKDKLPLVAKVTAACTAALGILLAWLIRRELKKK